MGIYYYNSPPWDIPEGTQRITWYEAGGYPSAYFDGVIYIEGGLSSGSMFNQYRNKVEERLAISSPLVMDFEITHDALARATGNITGTIRVDETVPAGQKRVYLVIVENHAGDKPNLARAFHDIKEFSLTDVGQSELVTYAFNIDPSWNAADLKFLIFVQNMTSKEVLQACQARIPLTAGIVVGAGPGPDAPTSARIYAPDTGGELTSSFTAYGANRYGINVASSHLVPMSPAQILTGPGPGPIFGPQVRAFEGSGVPFDGNAVNFLAYGTKKFGVKVAAGDIDGGDQDEILTGPGPGAVFGPHVRGFKYSGGTVNPVQGASFFSYGTRKFGVNVTAGDIDGDGYDEIITGPGPGAVFGPHIRAFDFDDSGTQPTPVPGVSFFAYGTKKWGANVAADDLDGDGQDEIIIGPGPGTVFGAQIRAFDYTGSGVAQVPGVNFFAYANSTFRYGVSVAGGNVNAGGNAEIITAPGPGMGYPAQIRVWNINAGATLREEFQAFGASDDTYGGHIAFGNFSE